MKCRAILRLAALLLAPSGLVAQAAELPRLDLSITGHEFRVQGGTSGALCTVLVGFERQHVSLPGGAELLIRPLVMFPIMQFDAHGEYSFIVGYDAKMLAPVAYHFQAIAVSELGFRTSEVQTLDFSNEAGDESGQRGGE